MELSSCYAMLCYMYASYFMNIKRCFYDETEEKD